MDPINDKTLPSGPPPNSQSDSNSNTSAETHLLPSEASQMLGGNRLIKRVGAGGMGEVWLAQDVKLQRYVALKTMRAEWAKNPESSSRFFTEARATAKLNHPNIIQIFQIGEDRGVLFFTMEWVEGESLEGVIKRENCLSLEHALEYTAQIVSGLGFAHLHQVIHRDIKPANVMIDAQRRAKIADFGLAKITDSDTNLTSTGVSMGSPNYMSPEMAKGEIADHRADIYAVGISLFQMLTGEVPFTGATATAVLLKQVQEELPITDQLMVRATPYVIEMIRHMTAKHPDDRYNNYDELYIDIQKALEEVRSNRHAMSAAGGPLLSPATAPTLKLPASQLGGSKDRISTGSTAMKGEPAPAKSSPTIGILAAVLLIGALAGGAWVYTQGKKDTGASESPHSPITSLRGIGEVVLPGINSQELAGEQVFVYTGASKDQMLSTLEAITPLLAAQGEKRREARSILERVRRHGVMESSLLELRKQIPELKRELQILTAQGTKANTSFEYLKAGVAKLESDLESFRRLGHSSLPIIDPLTGQTHILTTTGGKKDESITFISGLIQKGKQVQSTREVDLEKLKVEHETKSKQIATAEERLSITQAEMERSTLINDTTRFTTLFKEISTTNREIIGLLTPAIVKENLPEAAKTSQLDANGRFSMEGLPREPMALRLLAQVQREREKGKQTAMQHLWIVSLPPGVAAEGIRLTDKNLLAVYTEDWMKTVSQQGNESLIDSSLAAFLKPGFQENEALPFNLYVRAMLADMP